MTRELPRDAKIGKPLWAPHGRLGVAARVPAAYSWGRMGVVQVIGVGNALRGDDAAGLEVVARVSDEPGLERIVHEGEPIELLDMWTAADAAVLVDTVRSGASAGTIHRLDVSTDALPSALAPATGHTIDLGAVLELARTLGRLPARVVVFGIEGVRFDSGSALSPEVAAAIDSLADTVLREARLLLRGPPPGSR